MPSPTDPAYEIPFGKYAGEPLASLLADPAYCRWVVRQSFVFEYHPELWQVVTDHLAARQPQRRPKRPALDLPRELSELRFDFNRL